MLAGVPLATAPLRTCPTSTPVSDTNAMPTQPTVELVMSAPRDTAYAPCQATSIISVGVTKSGPGCTMGKKVMIFATGLS